MDCQSHHLPDRRRVVLAIAGSALMGPFASFAQTQQKIWRIGFLSGGPRPASGALPGALRRALEQLGYTDGRNITYAGRWAEARFERLPGMAAELVGLGVDVLLTSGAPAAEAAKQATSTIPIVFVAPGDAADTGLVKSLARPGGNITGISDPAAELSAKRLSLLKETIPGASRVAVIWDATDRAMTLRYNQIEKAARVLNLTVDALGVRDPEGIDAALSAMGRAPPDALFVVSNELTNINRTAILDFVAKNRIPAMYEFGYYVRDGGLMSYGPNFDDMWERAAMYVDKILKGTKAGELPVEQPMRYYLLVNLETAKALNISIPESVLLRADEVIK